MEARFRIGPTTTLASFSQPGWSHPPPFQACAPYFWLRRGQPGSEEESGVRERAITLIKGLTYDIERWNLRAGRDEKGAQ